MADLSSASAPGFRAGARGDISQLVAVHMAAFPNSFLTLLGGAFLAQYYKAVLAHPKGILLVGVVESRVMGFAAGILDEATFYQGIKRHPWRYVPAVAAGLIRRPLLSHRVVAALRWIVERGAARGKCSSCELTSVAVDPKVQGLGVGRRLVALFLSEARARGAKCTHLTTDADGNDSANAFYASLGFERSHSFVRAGGRRMHEYIYWEKDPSRATPSIPGS